MPIGDQFILSLGASIMAGIIMWFIYTEVTYNDTCKCGHRYNDHHVVPRGMKNPAGTEKCKLCGCRIYNKKQEEK